MTDNWNAWQDTVNKKLGEEEAAQAAAKAAEIEERVARIAVLKDRIAVLDKLYANSRRVAYRKEREILGEELDQLMALQMATDENSTPLEILQERIYKMEKDYEKSGNILDKAIIEQLKSYAVNGFDIDGQPLPLTETKNLLTQQVSPESVIDVDGWWNIQPSGYGKVPYWISNRLRNPESGLDVSVARSNGCFRVQNQVETANLWINSAEAIAAQYGVSARSIRMAGYNMANRWYMLPASNLQGAGKNKADAYAIKPTPVFNAAEKALWESNWMLRHGSGGIITATLAGAKFMAFELMSGEDQVDLSGRHLLFVIANRPELVVPLMMAYFNTNWFKQQEWGYAVHMAHEIDAGRELPVMGYEKVNITGSDKTAWYASNGEATFGSKRPIFHAGKAA